MTSITGNIVAALERLIRGPMSKVEVDRALSSAAEHKTEHLDWRRSVVDLLKVLDLPYSMDARETLAGELGFPGEFTGSATDNTTLYRLIMEDIAKRHVKIPKD